MAGYTYLDHVISRNPDPETTTDVALATEFATSLQNFVTALVVATLLLLLGLMLAKRLRASKARSGSMKDFVVPPEKLNGTGLFDLIMGSFISFHDDVVGKENRRHIPFTASLFFFIFAFNLFGLIPGMAAATNTVWVNLSLALISFIYFNYWGIKAHGLVNYLKHFMVVGGVLGLCIFPIELLSTSLRVLTLNLRLYWNIYADHQVLGVFTDLLPIGAAAPFYILGLFVSFMQAFVFTILSMLYILFATQHDEDHH